MNEVKALSSELKVIYCRDDLLLISNEIFEYIVSCMKLPENPNQVRKAIVKYLKRDKSGKKETYKYSF